MNIFAIHSALAETDAATIGKLVQPIITNVVYPILGLMFAVAVFIFTYGVIKLVIVADDSEARDSAKRSILYGSIGLFIMVSAWGIVWLISNTIKADFGSNSDIPANTTISPFTDQSTNF